MNDEQVTVLIAAIIWASDPDNNAYGIADDGVISERAEAC